MLLVQSHSISGRQSSQYYHNHHNDHPQQQEQQQPRYQSPSYNESTSDTSTQDWISSYPTPLTPTRTDFSCSYIIPGSEDQQLLFDYNNSHNLHSLRIQVQTPFGSSQEPELMPPDQAVAPNSWSFANGQLTPTSTRSHCRESSLSSLGSAGPASPYNPSTSHPQVLLPSDSGSETYYECLPIDHSHYHNYSKSLTPLQTPSRDPFLVPSFQDFSVHSYNQDPHTIAIMAMQKQHALGDEESISVPEYSHSGRPSVASTHESPATPPLGEEYEERKPDFRLASSIPKLDRTMSDAYNDELYSPNFTFTSAPPTKSTGNTTFPRSGSDIFSQRLQAASSQHLSASSQSLVTDPSRDTAIHFRAGSPLAPTANGFGSPQVRLNSAQNLREQQKAESDARALHQQLQRSSPHQSTPKTISPKDALLDYHETDDATLPLFPPQKASQQIFSDTATARRESLSTYSISSQTIQPPSSGFTFAPPSIPGRSQIPQQYPFVPQQRRQPSNMSSATDRTPDFPSTLTSMESSSSDYVSDPADIKKPVGSNADGGTYTCTYHGCTLRFETPAKLQKHKRDGHRQSAPLIGGSTSSRSGSSDGGNGMTSAALLRNSQAGPHKCERINPSTGKPCNTVFSRPYDLTRHEDTIHNARKQKVRCHLCTEEKTFSRNDALTRHMRVVHPEVDFPGKSRRRGELV